jgi:hypothetical protein
VSGWDLFKIGFTDLDAADRWLSNIAESMRYTRQLHDSKILTATDVTEWDDFFVNRWSPFRQKLQHPLKSPGYIQMMLSENKQEFDNLLKQARILHDKFVSKGMVPVAVPYMGELVVLLRTMPKSLTATEMRTKLEAGIVCGNKMLDENTAWWQWRKRSDTKGLSRAIANAKTAASIFTKTSSNERFDVGSPVYDEFLRRLTAIYIEAAGVYGIVETRQSAVAEGLDKARDATRASTDHLLWLLAAVGVSYLGIRWITRDKPTEIRVGVPDAIPGEQP